MKNLCYDFDHRTKKLYVHSMTPNYREIIAQLSENEIYIINL